MSGSDRFKEYLERIEDVSQDRCWLCCKTPDDIKREYYEYMKDPDEGFEEMDIDDIIIMTYKLQKPICAGCYFTIKNNPDLIKEIQTKPQDEVW